MIFTDNELEKLLSFAEKLIVVAGAKILSEENSFTIAVHKERMDIATSTDIDVENFIIGEIKKNFPEHQIFAEESGGELNPEIPTWVIDPIDGTKEFVRQVPIYGSVLTLEYQHQTLISVVYSPKTKELFSAGKGLGAFHNQRRVQVGDTAKLDDCMFFFKHPNYGQAKKIDEILSYLKFITLKSYRVIGSSNQNLAMCNVGIGGYDGYINIVNSGHWWDYSAGMLFLREAGGDVVTLDGEPFTYKNKGQLYFASNKHLTAQLVKGVQNYKLRN